MSGKAVAALAILLAACAPVTAGFPASEARVQGRALAAACEGRDGWSDAAPPARIFGNTYYVGTCGISVLLVTSSQGHVLIDGATAVAVPSILVNIRALGFDPRDIKLIVGSHEHVDHMGGFAALKAATGARLMMSAAARDVLESGRVAADDPQAGIIDPVPPVAVDEVAEDLNTSCYLPRPGMTQICSEQPVMLGLIPYFTPGHTDGGTSWSWQSCEGRNCATFAYVDSLSAVSRNGYRFTDHPERVAPFRATFARVNRMRCDILVTPHPGVSDLFVRLAGAAPLVDRDACRRLVHQMDARLTARLASEQTP